MDELAVMIKRAQEELGRQWAVRKEQIIWQSISRHLGRANWTPQEVAGRGKFIRKEGTKFEVLVFDGVEIATIYDLELVN